MSDIIFLNTWYALEPEKYYNPVLSYQDVRLMKTTWELRREKMLPAPGNPDSEYKQIERKRRVFNPLVISKVIMFFFKLLTIVEFGSQSSFCFKTKVTTKRKKR
jgi:hypothetical protein